MFVWVDGGCQWEFVLGLGVGVEELPGLVYVFS
jgi:hypothetical protein